MKVEQPSVKDTYNRYLIAGGSFRNAFSIFGYFDYNDMDEITARLKKRADRNGYLSYASKRALLPLSDAGESHRISEPPALYIKIKMIQGIPVYLFSAPLLIWEVAKWLVNRLIGKYISWAVLQVQYPSEASANVSRVVTQDGVELETYVVSPFKRKATQDKRIILFLGNGASVCFPPELQRWSDEFGCQVVSFSHRGCGDSGGQVRSADDLVCDGIAQVKQALKAGICPENITLLGQSLGAATATLVAYHFHQKGQEIKLFNDRGFSSISAFVTAHVLGYLASPQHTLGEFIQSERKEMRKDGVLSIKRLAIIGLSGIGWLLASLGTAIGYAVSALTFFILVLSKWRMNTVSAYNALPSTSKLHLTVSDKDHIILMASSLDKKVGGGLKATTREKDAHNAPLDALHVPDEGKYASEILRGFVMG